MKSAQVSETGDSGPVQMSTFLLTNWYFLLTGGFFFPSYFI